MLLFFRLLVLQISVGSQALRFGSKTIEQLAPISLEVCFVHLVGEMSLKWLPQERGKVQELKCLHSNNCASCSLGSVLALC